MVNFQPEWMASFTRIYTLKEKLKDVNHSAEKQLELTERAFACYASYWFENGTIEQKNTILKTIGSNFVLKDRKLSLELKNPWLFLTEDLKGSKLKKRKLEPSERLDSSDLMPAPSTAFSALLGGRCSNFFGKLLRESFTRSSLVLVPQGYVFLK